MLDILSLAFYLFSCPPLMEVYYCWALFSLSVIFLLYKDLDAGSRVGLIVDCVFYAVFKVSSFLIVIFTNYLIFAEIGTLMFGGNISVATIDRYNARTNSSINPDYVHLNWNDFGNSMVSLFAINLNNNMITLINWSSIH